MLLQPIETGGVRGVNVGFQRTLREAIQMLPQRWRDFFHQPQAYHRLEFFGSDIVAFRVVHGRSTEIGRVPRPDDKAAPTSHRSLQDLLDEDQVVAIGLPQSECLIRTLEMPKASQRHLRAALSYELERISPIELDRIYFDFFALGSDPTTKKVSLKLRIIKRDIVDDAIAYCHAEGLTVGAIGFSGERREADPRSFPVDRPAMLRLFWRRWNVPLLAAFAFVLCLTSLAAAYERGVTAKNLIEDQLEQERISALSVAHLHAEISLVRKQAEFLGHERAAPLFIETLADLTRILPDDTWLSEIEMNATKVRIQGNSKAASNLIAIIDRSGRFANAQFEAPVMRGQGDASDRFDLSFDVRGTAP